MRTSFPSPRTSSTLHSGIAARRRCAIVRRDGQWHHLGTAGWLAGGVVHRCPTQPGIDGRRGDLPGADRVHGQARAVLAVATGEDARHLGHLGLRSATIKPQHVLDSAAFEAGQIGALTGGENDLIGFERYQPIGVELGIELPRVVLGAHAELEGDLTVLVDAHWAPARVQLHALRRLLFRSRPGWPACRGASPGKWGYLLAPGAKPSGRRRWKRCRRR